MYFKEGGGCLCPGHGRPQDVWDNKLHHGPAGIANLNSKLLKAHPLKKWFSSLGCPAVLGLQIPEMWAALIVQSEESLNRLVGNTARGIISEFEKVLFVDYSS